MATLFFYKKKPEVSIFELEYFKDGKLDLDMIKEEISKNSASYNADKIFDSEGYTHTNIDQEGGILTTTYIFKNTLGQYTTIKYDESQREINVTRSPYIYFGQSRLLIKDDLNIMVKATYSSEEGVKGKCLTFLEGIGIDVQQVKFNNDIFQYIRNNYNWKKIKLQKIERERDSTRNISYEIDPSSDKESEVDKIYNDCGLFESIVFNIKFKEDMYVVKLYKAGHKIAVDDSQFKTKQLFEEFCVYLMDTIMDIITNTETLEDLGETLTEEGDD